MNTALYDRESSEHLYRIQTTIYTCAMKNAREARIC